VAARNLSDVAPEYILIHFEDFLDEAEILDQLEKHARQFLCLGQGEFSLTKEFCFGIL
jgi:hypothetical protein